MHRLLSVVLVGVLITTSVGCATGDMTREQRRECRRARGRAVGKAFGYTIGAVVLVAVFVAAAASGANIGGSGGSSRRSRERRARNRGLSVCDESPPPMRSARTLPTATPEPPPPPVADSGPPSREQLADALRSIEDQLRQCAPGGTGVLFIDANIDGATARVASYELLGDPADATDTQCVTNAVRQLRFYPFSGRVRVRWAVQISTQESGSDLSPPQK